MSSFVVVSYSLVVVVLPFSCTNIALSFITPFAAGLGGA